jgi:hypothetical protein
MAPFGQTTLKDNGRPPVLLDWRREFLTSEHGQIWLCRPINIVDWGRQHLRGCHSNFTNPWQTNIFYDLNGMITTELLVQVVLESAEALVNSTRCRRIYSSETYFNRYVRYDTSYTRCRFGLFPRHISYSTVIFLFPLLPLLGAMSRYPYPLLGHSHSRGSSPK